MRFHQVVLAACCMAGAPMFAFAGPPANDDCQSSMLIAAEGLYPWDNSNATTDGPDHAGCDAAGFSGVERDLWYCWVSPCSALVTVRTCQATGLDTKLAVYNGCDCPVNDARLLACDDDLCSLQSMVQFNAFAGVSYLIRVGNFQGAPGGGGAFEVVCGAPANSACPDPGSCCVAQPDGGCADEACCRSVCACDPFCCAAEWDSSCATFGFQDSGCGALALCDCGAQCGDADAGDCCSPHPTPSCSDQACCEAVCACDEHCCTVEWDDVCAGDGGCGAETLCAELCATGSGACCWYDLGACFEELSQAECQALDGQWTAHAECVEVTPACVPETGACCQRDGQCLDYFLTAADCEFAGGRAGPSTFCADLIPPCEPIGACCLPDERCLDDLPQDLCEAASGSWTGVSTCASLPPCTAPEGACCDGDTGICVDAVPFEDCQGEQLAWAEDTNCIDLNPSCEPPRGSCCDGTNGNCLDDAFQVDCVGEQLDWRRGLPCADRSPPCAEHVGACCNLLEGVCGDGVPGSACGGSGRVWTKGQSCSAVFCEPETGACCSPAPVGGCTDWLTFAECDCPGCEWTQATPCRDAGCVPPVIPAVGHWGLAVLALLLLIAAKTRRWQAAR